MKKRYLGTILLFVFVILGCYSKDNQKQTTEIDEPKEEILLATDENFIKIMTRTDEDFNYEIITKLEGNFTNSGYKEVVVFFNGQLKEHNKVSTRDARVFIVDNENFILNVYTLYYRHLQPFPQTPPYSLHIKEIDKFESTFKDAIITDFNGNGLLEFIYFVPEGSVTTFYIEEFKNGSFKHICQTYNSKTNTPGLDNFYLEHFDFEEKSMYLRNLDDNEIIKLKWNPETQFYDKEIISTMYTQLDSKLTEPDLANMSKGLLRLMRNAIYARHGRTFNSYDLQRFFNNKTWYKPNPNYSDDLLTDIDKYNIELIQKYEAKQ